MDRASQEKVIEQFSKRLVKLTESIPGYFIEKDVHDWRVEYKKLRAFLRMITAPVNGHVPIITTELKKIYRVTGTIRELSLFIAQLNTLPGIEREALSAYYSILEKKLFTAKEEFIRRTDIFSFEKELDRWKVMPPEYLETEQVKYFVQRNVTAMRLIRLVPAADENLHSLRKHLKDINYNIKTFTSIWGIPFPVTAWKNEKLLIEIAEELGEFNDRCSSLSFFEDLYNDQLPTDEKKILKELQFNLLSSKSIHQKSIIESLKNFSFFASVKEI